MLLKKLKENSAVKKNILGLLLSSLLGCASVNSVSLTPIPSQRGQPIKTEVSKWTFLGITFDNDFINPIVDNLKQKCPNGMVTGILTKDESIGYFLVFKHNVEVTGFCNTAATASRDKLRKPSGESEMEIGNE